MEDATNEYGYDDTMFVTETPEYLHCTICTLVLREPLMILDCGHKFCSVCFNRVKSHSVTANIPFTCPIDRKDVDLSQVNPDVAVKRLVGNLVVRCHEHERGCTWTGELSELVTHFVRCEYKPNVQQGAVVVDAVQGLTDRLEQCLLEKDEELALLRHDQESLRDEVQQQQQQQRQQQQQITD